MLQIYDTGQVIVDGRNTGLIFAQRKSGSVIYTPERKQNPTYPDPFLKETEYKEHRLPHNRYSAACDDPKSGNPGRAQLEADILSLLKKLKKEESNQITEPNTG